MTDGLGLRGAYDATIERIKAQEGDGARLGMEALMWISHSERPLSVDEICHALAVEIGSADINPNNVPSIRTVLSCCQGLVAVEEGSSTIRLIHFTLKEYLSGHVNLFDRPHSKIAETCLTYLNFHAIKDLSASDFRDRDTPFLGYSSLYWGIHMRIDISDRSRCLALALLDQHDSHISAVLLWESVKKQIFEYSTVCTIPFSALHCISYFGIVEVAIDLIKTKKWDVNHTDTAGLTPLMWAARCGHEEVVKLLIGHKHTRPDIPDTESGRTALSWAAGSGHEGVVRLLLGPLFINPGSIGRKHGVPEVMSIIFGRKYVNPDRPDNGGQTPLWWAVCNGHYGVVKLLLKREDVNPDRPHINGESPLLRAAINGHDGMVRLLLERKDLNPDRTNNHGQTPLSLAAEYGHDGVVKLLLERKDVSPDRPDNGGRTPLSCAAGEGHDGVLKLLLEQKDVSPDRPDIGGQTPLSWAAEKGHYKAVNLLLEREDVSPDRPDDHGRTPLLFAAAKGRDEVVELLLERKDVSPDRPDNDGRTPLLCAAWCGNHGVVKLLLERKDVSPDRPDNNGRTPLSCAARCGDHGVVKLLLEREDVNPHRPDIYGETPLSRATQNRNYRVVKLLEARKPAPPSAI